MSYESVRDPECCEISTSICPPKQLELWLALTLFFLSSTSSSFRWHKQLIPTEYCLACELTFAQIITFYWEHLGLLSPSNDNKFFYLCVVRCRPCSRYFSLCSVSRTRNEKYNFCMSQIFSEDNLSGPGSLLVYGLWTMLWMLLAGVEESQR